MSLVHDISGQMRRASSLRQRIVQPDEAPRRTLNIFVVGPDAFNARKLEQLSRTGPYAFHPLLEMEDVTSSADYDLGKVLDQARRTLRSYPERVDGIIGYWDFPVSLIVPMLSAEFGLCSPRFESVLKCEHKYWSRVEQAVVIPDHVPRFQSLDPFDDTAVDAIALDYPFWIKPVKSFSSHLGFRVGNGEELHAAVAAIRRGIRELGNAFNQFLAHATLPEAVARVDGNHCIVEAIVSGHQCTVEGFTSRGRIEIYGVVDSFRHHNRSSFKRYQYPSSLPRAVKERMRALCERVIGRIGLDNAPFNVEFFWNRRTDQLWLLEINPRISQSHGDLFTKVDGTPHHRVLVDLALGKTPDWSKGGGEFAYAAKFFIRHFRDATVTRVPSAAEVAEIQARFPGTLVELLVREGMRLSELPAQDQDSYSYVCALVFMGANTPRELLRNFADCEHALRFEFNE